MLALKRYPNQFPSLFDSGLFDDIFNLNINNDLAVRTPLNDIIENENEFIVESVLAGVKKEDISLDINDGILTIKAERRSETDGKYNRKESFYGKYEKSFSLPDNVNVDKIDAEFVDGILKLNIPKLENDPKISKVIEIK